MTNAVITWVDPIARVNPADPVGSPFLSQVNVFMSVDNGNTYTNVGHAAPGQQTFTQPLPAPDSYPATFLFKLEAVDSQAHQQSSADSAVVSVTVDAPDLSAPLPPTNVAVVLSA